MTKEEKQLLLIDLCARVPHGVKYNFGGNEGCDYTMDRISLNAVDDAFPIEDIKPYLRPMSSMTENEEKEFEETLQYTQYTLESYDWLNAHHFDYRGLFEKGLALEAPEDMYKN